MIALHDSNFYAILFLWGKYIGWTVFNIQNTNILSSILKKEEDKIPSFSDTDINIFPMYNCYRKYFTSNIPTEWNLPASFANVPIK